MKSFPADTRGDGERNVDEATQQMAGAPAPGALAASSAGAAAGVLAAAAVRPKLPPPPTTPGYEADLLDD